MRVAISGWFSGQTVGSGQYTDELLVALRGGAREGDQFALVAPERRTGRVGKVLFEQVVFPRLASGYDVAHVPYSAMPSRPLPTTVLTVHDLILLVLDDYRGAESAGMLPVLVDRHHIFGNGYRRVADLRGIDEFI